jgi:hypothetical protein
MPYTLEDEELKTVRDALDNYLPELRYELARVKLQRERHPLVEFEAKLSAIRKRLG